MGQQIAYIAFPYMARPEFCSPLNTIGHLKDIILLMQK